MLKLGCYYKVGDGFYSNIKIDIRRTRTKYVVEHFALSDPAEKSYGNVCRGTRTGIMLSKNYYKDIVSANKRAEKIFMSSVIGRCPNCGKYPEVKATSGKYKFKLIHNESTCPVRLESFQLTRDACISDWHRVCKEKTHV